MKAGHRLVLAQIRAWVLFGRHIDKIDGVVCKPTIMRDLSGAERAGPVVVDGWLWVLFRHQVTYATRQRLDHLLTHFDISRIFEI